VPLVRLASRAVIGAFDRAADVGKALSELAKSNIQPVNVSLIGKAESFPTNLPVARGKGRFGALGKSSEWLGRPRRDDKPGFGTLLGTGVLADVLAESPNTSPVGALVMQGIPQRDAVTYADLLRDSKLLLFVDVADRTVGERVRGILSNSGATAVTYYSGRPYGTAYHGTGPGLR
jgi:hypothetical protein